MAGAPAGVVEDLWRQPGRPAADLLWEHLALWEQPWLLVFDNADDLGVLACEDCAIEDGTGWLRPPVGASAGVIVTTRDRNRTVWGAQIAEMAELEVPDPLDCVAVLTDLAPDAGNGEEATALSELLGRLPLALHLAGSYLAEAAQDPFAEARSFSEYARAFSERADVLDDAAKDLPGDRRDEDSRSRATVARTWDLSLQLLDQMGLGSSRDLLRLLACYAPSVPLPAVLLTPERIATFWNDDRLTTRDVARHLRGLHRFGLLNATVSGNVPEYEMHPLVAEASGRPLLEEPENHRDFWHLATQLLMEASPHQCRDPSSWPTWHAIAPHWVRLITHLPIGFDDAVIYGCLPVAYLRSRGEYALAQQLVARLGELAGSLAQPYPLIAVEYQSALIDRDIGSLARAENKLREIAGIAAAADPAGREILVAVQFELGTVLRARGRLRESEHILREVLATEREIYGPESHEVLLTLSELAAVTRGRGRYSDAVAVAKELAHRFEAALGRSHVDTLASLHEYAVALRDDYRFDEAVSVFTQVHDLERATLGEEHPSTLDTRNSLAATIRLQGHTEQASAELASILEARIRLFGPEHPRTLSTRHDLLAAAIIDGTVGYEVAEQELREIILGNEKYFSADHLGLAIGVSDLAAVQARQGKHREALDVLQPALEATTAEHGFTAPQTMLLREQIADIFRETGHYEEAIDAYRGVLAGYRETVGATHPQSLAVEASIGKTLILAGRYGEAEQALRETVDSYARRNGATHPITLDVSEDYAITLLRMGRTGEALELLTEILAQQLVVVGRSSDDVRHTRNTLGLALRDSGLLDEAIDQYDQSLDSIPPSQRDGITALMVRQNRASLMASMGRVGEAESELRHVLAVQIQAHGNRSAEVLAVRHSLAKLLDLSGRWERAELEYRDVYDLRVTVLGTDCLETLVTAGCLAHLLYRSGRLDEADAIYRMTSSKLPQVAGDYHPETMTTMHNRAYILCDRGDTARAERLFRKVIQARRAALGMAHPNTLLSETSLCGLLRRQRRSTEAVPLLRDIVRRSLEAHGQLSESSVGAQYQFGCALAEVGQFEDAVLAIKQASLWARQFYPSGDKTRREIAEAYERVLGVTRETEGGR